MMCENFCCRNMCLFRMRDLELLFIKVNEIMYGDNFIVKFVFGLVGKGLLYRTVCVLL